MVVLVRVCGLGAAFRLVPAESMGAAMVLVLAIPMGAADRMVLAGRVDGADPVVLTFSVAAFARCPNNPETSGPQ